MDTPKNRLEKKMEDPKRLPVPIPTTVKFVIVSAIAAPVCLLLSPLIRQIPYAKRVLG
jgi:hypothetical protein